MIPKKKRCVSCGRETYIWARGKCKSCDNSERVRNNKNVKFGNSRRKTPIKQMSAQRKRESSEYNKNRKKFLEGNSCAICGTTQGLSIHHKMGRVGYSDEFARLNKTSLYLDERFWVALCIPHHKWVEEHPEEAIKKGYSLKRLNK
jgi:hypothetical protein